MESVVTVGEIMHRMGLHSCIVVSDGYHIYRVKKMLEARGLRVYGSPRPSAPVSRWFYFRQAAGYVLWRVGIRCERADSNGSFLQPALPDPARRPASPSRKHASRDAAGRAQARQRLQHEAPGGHARMRNLQFPGVH